MFAATGPNVIDVERAGRGQITVVIADDHAVVRRALRLLIDKDDVHVVAEAANLPDAERLTRAHRPAVLLLDLNLHGGSGLDAIPRLLQDVHGTAIVVLSMQDDPAFARQALHAGALGFVLKEVADEELLDAIRLAAASPTSSSAAAAATRPPPRRTS